MEEIGIREVMRIGGFPGICLDVAPEDPSPTFLNGLIRDLQHVHATGQRKTIMQRVRGSRNYRGTGLHTETGLHARCRPLGCVAVRKIPHCRI